MRRHNHRYRQSRNSQCSHPNFATLATGFSSTITAKQIDQNDAANRNSPPDNPETSAVVGTPSPRKIHPREPEPPSYLWLARRATRAPPLARREHRSLSLSLPRSSGGERRSGANGESRWRSRIGRGGAAWRTGCTGSSERCERGGRVTIGATGAAAREKLRGWHMRGRVIILSRGCGLFGGWVCLGFSVRERSGGFGARKLDIYLFIRLFINLNRLKSPCTILDCGGNWVWIEVECAADLFDGVSIDLEDGISLRGLGRVGN